MHTPPTSLFSELVIMLVYVQDIGSTTLLVPQTQLSSIHSRLASSPQVFSDGSPARVKVLVEGPYGSPRLDLHGSTYSMFLLISGGIGVTPMQVRHANNVGENVSRGHEPTEQAVAAWNGEAHHAKVLESDGEWQAGGSTESREFFIGALLESASLGLQS